MIAPSRLKGSSRKRCPFFDRPVLSSLPDEICALRRRQCRHFDCDIVTEPCGAKRGHFPERLFTDGFAASLGALDPYLLWSAALGQSTSSKVFTSFCRMPQIKETVPLPRLYLLSATRTYFSLQIILHK